MSAPSDLRVCPECRREGLIDANDALVEALAALVDAGDEATDFTSGPAVTVFNAAMSRARAVLSLYQTQETT